MKTFKQFTLITLALISFNGVANQSLKTVNSEALLNSYIQNIESKFIGKQINVYDKQAIANSIKIYNEYLMLCNKKLASNKCEEVKTNIKILRANEAEHLLFESNYQKLLEAVPPLINYKLAKQAEAYLAESSVRAGGSAEKLNARTVCALKANGIVQVVSQELNTAVYYDPSFETAKMPYCPNGSTIYMHKRMYLQKVN